MNTQNTISQGIVASMALIGHLIERSLQELGRRKQNDTPDCCECEIQRHNQRAWSVSIHGWIVFLDTKSGEPEAYHALPLSTWNG